MSPSAATAIEDERTLVFGDESFSHVIQAGPAAREDLAGRFALMDTDQFILVTTEGVPRGIVEYVHYCLGVSAPVTLVTVPDGEKNKTDATAGRIACAASEAGASHDSVVVGLGGGGLINMAAFVASTYLRGIRLVELPTTFLAWCDVTPTLKTSVNLTDGSGQPVGKNKRGTYYAPEWVWADAGWFRSLPADEVRSGMGEVIKAMVAITPERIAELRAVLRRDARYTQAELARSGGLCIAAKQLVMRHDPLERGPAYVLHSGHDVGCQAEVTLGIPHGIAISTGCLVAHRAAEILGHMGPEVRELHTALLRAAGIPVAFPAGASPERLVRGLYRGSARGLLKPRDGYVDMVLLSGLGIPLLTGDRPLTQVPEHVAVQAVRDIQAAA